MELTNISDELDTLFTLYLELLHEYDVFRKKLSKLQVQQNLARANFNAERGIRYGEELYDARMQASRFCYVTVGEKGIPAFTVGHLDASKTSCGDAHGENCSDNMGRNGNEDRAEILPLPTPSLAHDPIRMFGILTPPQLRLAQVDSIKMVEEVIPKLIGLIARMTSVEAQIFRLQKLRDRVKSKKLELGDENKDILLSHRQAVE